MHATVSHICLRPSETADSGGERLHAAPDQAFVFAPLPQYHTVNIHYPRYQSDSVMHVTYVM